MRNLSCWSAAALLFLSACGGDKPATTGTTPAEHNATTDGQGAKPAAKGPEKPVRLEMPMIQALFGADPSSPKVDNPSTPEKVALGRMLYHEQSLSKNGNMSCASCHDLANYGQDGKKTSPGSDGTLGERNTPTTWNAFRQFAQFWDYRAKTVEDQAIMPVLNPIEHGVADEAALITKIKAKPELVEGFKKAFGDGDVVSVPNFKLAVGAFERTLVTKSRFDDFLDGNDHALTNAEKKGLKTFIDVGCNTCHMSRLVGGSMPQTLGVKAPYPSEDIGRAKVTGEDKDKFLFKVPSLLNVEKTAPYNHDGRYDKLEDAVANMAKIQLDKTLSADEIASIVTFLKTLTGQLPADIVSAR